MTAPGPESFVPSTYHRRRQRERKPRLSYPGGDPAPWKEVLREAFADCLGFPHIPFDEPPTARLVDERRHPQGKIERWILEVEPGVEAPLLLGLPGSLTRPCPPLICLQGHGAAMHESLGVAPGDLHTDCGVARNRDFGLQAMREGFAAVCFEQRCFGERAERLRPHGKKDSACQDAAMNALHLGWTLTAERLFDLRQVVRWIGTQPALQAAQIGLLGESGGGTTGLYAAAFLPELRHVAAACGFGSFATGILEIAHCTEMYLPGLQPIAEAGDLLGLLSPRPVNLLAGTRDPFYPIAGVRAAVEQARRIYAAEDAEDQLTLLEADVEHEFVPEVGWPAIRRAADQARKSAG